jgi:hypothetical protein
MMPVVKSVLLTMLLALSSIRISAAAPVFFLVSTRPGCAECTKESFVLALSAEADIAYARYIMSRVRAGWFSPDDRTIVVATIVAATEDINRNYLDPRFPKWSWQVGEFRAFAQIVAEGEIISPMELETWYDWSSTHPLPWEPFYVGFDGMYVVRELGPVPLFVSVTSEAEQLQFYWSGVGSNYVYTLEGKETLPSANWVAIPGATWPVKTNHWSLPLVNASARFYRVRAEVSD